MNRFFKSALAIAAVGTVANAAPGDNEWLELDSEINGLSSALQPSQDGMGWAALIRAVFSYSSDDIATAGGADVSGFDFNDVDLAFWGNQGPYMWRVNTDINNNSAGLTGSFLELEDAYVRWNCGGYFDTTMGQFKPHVLRSANVNPEDLLFINRTALGSSLDFWDTGIELAGNWEQQLNWTVALTDGTNAEIRDHFYAIRLEWMLGAGAGMYEGAMGSNDQLNGSIGLSWIHDDSLGDLNADGKHDNSAIALDFNGNVSNVGFGFEVMDIDKDAALATDEDFSFVATPLIFQPDSTPWNVTLSYLLNPEWEFGVRYEEFDNASNGGPDNQVLSLVANWYHGGNAGKWQIQWTDVSADTGNPDGSVFEIGYVVGSSD
jgi:hypothetical protein